MSRTQCGSFWKTLHRGHRVWHVAQMMRIATEELPIIPLYFDIKVTAFASALNGPVSAGGPFSQDTQAWHLE